MTAATTRNGKRIVIDFPATLLFAQAVEMADSIIQTAHDISSFTTTAADLRKYKVSVVEKEISDVLTICIVEM